ncbi:MAG: biotin--[acetyl-CoA-carboxylase] ligase [Thermomicrobiales bacterium]
MIVGRRIIRLERVTSTMAEIDRLAANGEPEGTVVVADKQTAGRGRAGRLWHAPAGTAILCSILMRPPLPAERLTPLPLLAGVAVAAAIEDHAPVRCYLKWPNDVWIDGNKVAGILMTSRANSNGVAHVNIGIGVNVNTPKSELPDGATSLDAVSGHEVDRDQLLRSILARIDEQYERLVSTGAQTGLDAWRDRAALIDDDVVVVTANGEETGQLLGIDDDGALLLAQHGVTKRFVVGDLTRGPRLMQRPVRNWR